MNTIRASFGFSLIGVFVLLGTVGTADAGGVLPIAEGISVPYGDGWSPAPPLYRNAVELVRGEPGDARGAVRVLVSWEERSDRSAALLRLRQIGDESTTTVYTEVCGWPGLRQRYTRQRTLPGQDLATNRGERVLQVVTAVAVDHTIVRLLGSMPAHGDERAATAMAAMGANLRCARVADAAATRRALDRLRSMPPRVSPAVPLQESAEPTPAGATTAAPGPSAGAPQRLQNGFGELEITASPDGQHIVMAANSGYSTSHDGGVSFATTGAGLPAPGGGYTLNGDPSLAYGASGTFYYAVIGFPMGRGGPQCSTAMYSSSNNGQSFNYVADAFRCDDNNGPNCFPDQEHIAADAFNPAPGGDQVYSTWRNFGGGCNNLTSETPSIVCSADSGQNWSAPTVINGGNGIYPRISVGSDGFVYVVYEDSGNVMLDKYSSCANGLVLQPMFPATVSAVTPITCPVPGLDRCNSGNRLTSHMVAVDDTNPNHVYVAFATETTASVDADVLVIDSTDGGVNWGTPVRVNTNTNGVRFMPWVCSAGGAARVGWYDRRAGNDSTDYYCGNAAPGGGGNLIAGAETNLTNNPDPQCNSGWPCPPRATGDAEGCPMQPQLAGRCCTVGLVSGSCPAGMGSNQQCDYSSTVCPGGETCQLGRGCPKYGDYNGNACVAGRVLNAWASATAPAGLPNPGGIAVFFDTKLAGAPPDLTISKVDVPDPVIAGTNLVYTVTVTNNGPASAMNVVWTDDLPSPSALVGFAGITAVPGWSCATPPLNNSGTITCSKPFMAIGETQDFDITLLVRNNVPNLTMLSNGVEIGSDDPGGDMETITTLVITRADLRATKSDSPDPVIAGTDVTYSMAARNFGPSDAQNVQLTDPLPLDTTFQSASPSAGGICTTPAVGVNGVVQCTWAGATRPIPADTRSVTIVAHVVPSAPEGSVLTDITTASSDTVDPSPGDNDGTAMTGVITRADLEIMKVDMPDPALIGGILTFTVTVKNLGPSDAQNAVVNEQVPDHTSFHSIDVPPGWACATPPVFGSGMIQCTTPTFAFDAEAVFTVHVLVDAGAMDGVDVLNMVEIGSDTIDPNPDNNPATTDTDIVPAAPLLDGRALAFALATLLALAAARLRRRGTG